MANRVNISFSQEQEDIARSRALVEKSKLREEARKMLFEGELDVEDNLDARTASENKVHSNCFLCGDEMKGNLYLIDGEKINPKINLYLCVHDQCVRDAKNFIWYGDNPNPEFTTSKN